MVIVPTLHAEAEHWSAGGARIAGVDECGIGSLAGPVVAAAVILPPFCTPLPGVRDSKTLNLPRREALYPLILEHAIAVAVGAASCAEIERFNVRRASWLAMRRALARVIPTDHVLVDGLPIKDEDFLPHTAIVDGDALSYSIACASIVAKVTRDRLMRRLARRYPAYHWQTNAGYGSPEHLAALREHGVTPYHRRGYAPVRAILVCTGKPTASPSDRI